MTPSQPQSTREETETGVHIASKSRERHRPVLSTSLQPAVMRTTCMDVDAVAGKVHATPCGLRMQIYLLRSRHASPVFTALLVFATVLAVVAASRSILGGGASSQSLPTLLLYPPPRWLSPKSTESAPLSEPLMTAVRLRSRLNYSLKHWLPCASGGNAHSPSVFVQQHRRTWRDPPIATMRCFPRHGKCWRGVFDGRINVSGHVCTPEGAGSSCTAGTDTEAWYLNQMRQVLSAEFGVSPSSIIASYTRWVNYEKRSMAHRADSNSINYGNWSELHADYYEDAGYVFSNVLFLGDEEEDAVARVGGESGVADELENAAYGGHTQPRLKRGLLVEPRQGRLLTFTGGGENYHAPLPLLQGRRTTFHAWFKCRALDEEGLTDQKGTSLNGYPRLK